jgi:7,8-dihydropterin-6-yl-methyl-4-(beta-D-ribofuranosyl)aminobenzene 5'-phosphate synthase
MKITIIYDNTVYNRALKADWGFSCLVEVENTPKMLFDTGANGAILLSNMKNLNIDPLSIEEIFISHAHYDHTGGLSEFLNVNNNINLYVPPIFKGCYSAKEVTSLSRPTAIHNNIYSTGELDNIEQSLIISTDRGLVLIVGCSHPKMSHILDTASQYGQIYAIIGGMHGFKDFDLFKDMELICPTHCTEFIKEIKSLYPDAYTEGGAGRIIEL